MKTPTLTRIKTHRDQDHVRVVFMGNRHEHILPHCQVIRISKLAMWPWNVDVVPCSFAYSNMVIIALISCWVKGTIVEPRAYSQKPHQMRDQLQVKILANKC
jgi:hypothetical protein